MVGITAFFPARARSTAALPSVGLIDVGLGGDVAGRALQVVGQRPMVLVAEAILEELRHHLPDPAQLGVAEASLPPASAISLPEASANPSETATVQ